MGGHRQATISIETPNSCLEPPPGNPSYRAYPLQQALTLSAITTTLRLLLLRPARMTNALAHARHARKHTKGRDISKWRQQVVVVPAGFTQQI